MLFFLLAGHALMDFALQPEPMAVCKCRKSGHPLLASVPWFYWLASHCLVHGAAVAAVMMAFHVDPATAIGFGLVETVVHWFVDLGKCEGWFNIHVDQGLHVTCKVFWWLLVTNGVSAAMFGV